MTRTKISVWLLLALMLAGAQMCFGDTNMTCTLVAKHITNYTCYACEADYPEPKWEIVCCTNDHGGPTLINNSITVSYGANGDTIVKFTHKAIHYCPSNEVFATGSKTYKCPPGPGCPSPSCDQGNGGGDGGKGGDGGDGGKGGGTAGNGGSKLGSINTYFYLGRSANGAYAGYNRTSLSAGYLLIEAAQPDAALATPDSLQLANAADDVDLVNDNLATNRLRQVMAPDCLADIITNTSFKYSLNFYHPSDIEADLDTNGYYVVKSGHSPFTVWTIENPAADTNDIDTLRITQLNGGATNVNEYVYAQDTNGATAWTLSLGNGLRQEELNITTNGTERTKTFTVRNDQQALVARTRQVFKTYAWGDCLVEETVDPDGLALATLTSWHTNANESGYGQPAMKVNADGGWERYEHNANGTLAVTISSWQNAATNAAAAAARAAYNNYAAVDANDDGSLHLTRPRAVTRKILDQAVDKTYYAYYENGNGDYVELEERCGDASAAYGAAGNLRTERIYNPESASAASSQRLKSATWPDGRHETYAYEYGVYTTNADPALCSFTPNATGDYIRATLTHGATNSPDGIANKTTREVTIEDRAGRTVMGETYAYAGGANYTRVAWTVSERDELGRTTAIHKSNGAHSEATWGCCGKEWEKDESGIEYSYTYDALQRLVQKVKSGNATQADQYTTYTYDAEGRVLAEVVSASSLSLGKTNQYDLAGRITNSTDFAGLVTRTSYSADSLTTTETLPGGFTRVTERYKDGQIKNITGTAQIAQYYDYGVNEDGTKWSKVFSASNNSPVWVKTTTDFLGRAAKVEKPGYSGTETTEYFYNSKGQLVKTTTTGKPDTLYAYDEVGNQIRSGLDVNANGDLDLAGLDRISESDASYELISDIWYLTSVSKLYATDNDATPLTNSITRQRLTGFTGTLISDLRSLDVNGNETITTVNVDRANKTVTQSTDVPDSISNAVNISVNGLLVSAQRSTLSAPTLFTYDSLGRRTGTTDPRLSAATTHYDSHGWVDYVQDAAGHRTTYTYDSATGRKLSQTDPLTNTTYYAYTSHGQLEKTWGSAAYPVLYEYDGYGRMTKMSTYRGGSGWSSSTWPADPGTADTTEWIYHEASGLLTSKKDAAGKSVSYTYLSGGKLASRTWARVNGTNSLVTTYSYSTNSGDLSAIDYSDSTPDVSFTYDRLGRQKTAESSVSSHSFSYAILNLQSEIIVTDGVTNTISRTHDNLGRPTGFDLSDMSYSVAYGYTSLGRFNSVSSSVESVSSVVNYSYLPNSDLISSLSLAVGSLSSVSTRSYEDHRNLLTQLKNQIDSTTLSQYDYANDAGGRRASIKYSGTAFDVGASFNKYDYNNRSEVLSGDRYWGTDLGDTSDPVLGQGFAYAYDNIGNRQSAMRDNEETTYTANNLNQYSQRTISDLIDVLGSAETGTTVTVNNLAVSRHQKYWHKGLAVTNASSAVYQQVNVVGVYNPPGTNEPDVVATVTGQVFVAKTPEQFSYDDDGNQLSDGRFNYTWDAENRLIAVETATNLVGTAVPAVRLEFAYDYMSRRVSKTVYSGLTNGVYSSTNVITFLYDGWNLISEVGRTVPGEPSTNHYVYGLDLSGSLQGAGGIGGLLAARLGTNNVCYTYDANGNVSELLTTGSWLLTPVVAHYEYSPFGETIVATGDLAQNNPFRFSTKYFDDEAGLSYYGYRYYSPSLGRWLSRDPIGELGSISTRIMLIQQALVINNFNAIIYTSILRQIDNANARIGDPLYLFVNNNSANRTDVLGLNGNEPPDIMKCCPDWMHDWVNYNSCFDRSCDKAKTCVSDGFKSCLRVCRNEPSCVFVCDMFVVIPYCKYSFSVDISKCPGPTCAYPPTAQKTGCPIGGIWDL